MEITYTLNFLFKCKLLHQEKLMISKKTKKNVQFTLNIHFDYLVISCLQGITVTPFHYQPLALVNCEFLMETQPKHEWKKKVHLLYDIHSQH